MIDTLRSMTGSNIVATTSINSVSSSYSSMAILLFNHMPLSRLTRSSLSIDVLRKNALIIVHRPHGVLSNNMTERYHGGRGTNKRMI